MILKDLGEFKLIEKIAKGIKLSSQVVKGVGDDAAVLKYTKDKFLLFTTDMLLEDRHFYRKDEAYLVGKKAVSVNVSDIAAMGGIPKSLVVSLGVPSSLNVRYVKELSQGIKSAAKKFDIDLVGGDMVLSEKIIVNIALLGEVERKNLVLRSGAKPGDSIFVTGYIGGSNKGKHLRFTPRLKEARFLVKNLNIHSMIDLSDGLLADLGHILERSKVGAFLDKEDVPIATDASSLEKALTDGEDFELLFTISHKDEKKLIKKWSFNTKLSKIGIICKKGKLNFKPVGYAHF